MKILSILTSAFWNTPNIYSSLMGKSSNKTKQSSASIKHELDGEHWTIYSIMINTMRLFMIRLPFHCPSWMPSWIRLLLFGTNTSYLPAQEEVHQGVCVIFVNGILTNHKVVESNRCALQTILNRPVNVLHNATDSLFGDLFECLLGKTTFELTEASHVALHTVCKKMLDPRIEKIVVIAHSQGTIIMATVLKHLHRLGLNKRKYVQKLEIYCISNCASEMQYVCNNMPYMEHFANSNDIVAKMGCNCAKDIRHLIHIDGKKFVSNKSGHLLNMHYLHNFVCEYPNSKLIHYIIK